MNVKACCATLVVCALWTVSALANEDPVLVTNTGLTVAEGTSGLITNSMLMATDPDNPPHELTFNVTGSPAHGFLEVAGTPASIFTQAQIDSGLVSYTHDGGETTADSFIFNVSDGAGGTLGSTVFIIGIIPQNDQPVLATNTGFTVAEGTSRLITNSRLKVTDDDNPPEQLIFSIITDPSQGTLNLAGELTSTFTQADIDDALVSYSHDGGNTTPDSFLFNVTDGAGGNIGPTVFDITVAGIYLDDFESGDTSAWSIVVSP